MNAPLLEFVRAAKAKGASDQGLLELMRAGGWGEASARDALQLYYEEVTGLPLPRRVREAGNRPLDGFLYLVIFSTLATWTQGLGSVFYTLIEHAFPDTTVSFGFVQGLRLELSGALARVIIAFPVFLLVSRYALRHLEHNPEARTGGVRRWLTAIALVVAAGFVVGDLVTLLAYLLRGDLTTRFLLKVLVVLVISGGVFLYYLPWLGWRQSRDS